MRQRNEDHTSYYNFIIINMIVPWGKNSYKQRIYYTKYIALKLQCHVRKDTLDNIPARNQMDAVTKNHENKVTV